MKIINYFFLSFSIYTFIYPAVLAQENTGAIVEPKFRKYDKLKKTIAIINFSSANPSIDASVGKGITDMLITNLIKSGQFVVIERGRLNKVLAESESPEHMVVTGLITPKTAIQIGGILNTDTLITGRVINFGLAHTSRKKDYFIVGLEANVISTKTGKTLSANESIAKSKHEIDIQNLRKAAFQSKAFIKTLMGEATKEAVNTLVSDIENTMVSYPWEGNIIKVLDNVVYISGGKKIGLRARDRLVVLKETERTEDTATGALIKRKLELIGEVQIRQLEEDYAICSIVKGKEFGKGHIVQLKEEYEEQQNTSL